MVTKRTPIGRPQQRRITPEAIAIFRRLRRATTKEEYNAIGWQLHEALNMLPCDSRVAYATTDESPYAEQERGTWGALSYPNARALYVELEAASRAAAKAKRQRGSARGRLSPTCESLTDPAQEREPA